MKNFNPNNNTSIANGSQHAAKFNYLTLADWELPVDAMLSNQMFQNQQ